MPAPVLGGAGIVLFGSVAASGIRTLADVDHRDNMNLIIVASTIGIGMLPIAAPDIYAVMPSWFRTVFESGISSAAAVAITLNLVFNHWTLANSEQSSVIVAAPARMVREDGLNALQKDDR